MCLALYRTLEKHYLKISAQQSFEEDAINYTHLLFQILVLEKLSKLTTSSKVAL